MNLKVATLSQLTEWLPILIGLGLLFVPMYVDLAHTIWASDDQAHGPIILAVAFFFIWKNHKEVLALPDAQGVSGWLLLILGVLIYSLGRSQDILIFEVGSQIPIIAGLIVIIKGWKAVGVMWFPLFFLLFMLPLPSEIVDSLTLPMKMAVSSVAESVLHWAGYPISRSGVILQIGQYKLLVADACAGLHTLFTLEALGLLYLNIVRHTSLTRNTVMAIMIVPISFSANTIRVVALTLITFHFGDEAGQGFLHQFAGMVLFISALLLTIGFDLLLQLVKGLKPQSSRSCRANSISNG